MNVPDSAAMYVVRKDGKVDADTATTLKKRYNIPIVFMTALSNHDLGL